MIFLIILILAVGFAALIKGANLFVDGSVPLARIFRTPPGAYRFLTPS